MAQQTARPSVSVALCTRNGARFVGEQVRSILAQTVPPVEIVLSDDASTDETVAIVEALVAPSAVRLTVLRNDPPLGVTKNFERAVTRCSGDLVALSDQDDVWRADRLERTVALFEADPGLLLAGSDARLIDADGVPLPHSLFESLELDDDELESVDNGGAFAALRRRNLVTGATAVFRRSLVADTVPFPTSWVHDEWLAVIASALGRVMLVEEQLVDYRQHGTNQIGAEKKGFREKFERLTMPRSDRNARLEARAEALVERLRSWGEAVAPSTLALAVEKLTHERVRNSLPVARIRRLAPVIAEVRSGRYESCGRGLQDVVRDLVQPAR